jgi:ubiquinone/menaquinone biosynthesis C-methylase UbiE
VQADVGGQTARRPRNTWGMEDTDYVLGRTSGEYDRLIEQADLLAPLTRRLFTDAGIDTDMRVLDVGCGVGDVSFLLHEFVGSGGAVIGIDLDEGALGVADQRRADRGLTNVSFRKGDARTTDFDEPFDAAVGRLVLMFMNDPTDALRRIADRVRPGGILAFHEWAASEGGVSTVTHPALADLQRLIEETFERSEARLDIGTEMHGWMVEAGLAPTSRPLAEFAVTSDREGVGYRRWALFARSLLPKIVEYGLSAEGSVETLLARVREELSASRSVIPLTWLMIGQWARKPRERQIALIGPDAPGGDGARYSGHV